MNIRLIGSVLGLSLVSTQAFGASMATLERRADNAAVTFQEWVDLSNESRIPRNLLNAATCVAVIPNMIKGAIIFGARRGTGLATCRMANGNWANPVYVDLTGISYGFQIGFQQSDVVLVFTRSSAPSRLSRGNITLGADASIAIGPVGRRAEAATDWILRSEIYSYSRDRGIFAGISLAGAFLKPDRSDNRKVYGHDVTLESSIGTFEAPPSILRDFVSTMNRY